jgi:hypothetical protein
MISVPHRWSKWDLWMCWTVCLLDLSLGAVVRVYYLLLQDHSRSFISSTCQFVRYLSPENVILTIDLSHLGFLLFWLLGGE